MSRNTLPDTMKDALTEYEVTLDGYRAVITGTRKRFARIVRLDNGHAVEYAWPTVDYIVHSKEGKFRS